ncbi:hypothetical protein EV121DRAFT_257135, partial [Schizophyllum commune]
VHRRMARTDTAREGLARLNQTLLSTRRLPWSLTLLGDYGSISEKTSTSRQPLTTTRWSTKCPRGTHSASLGVMMHLWGAYNERPRGAQGTPRLFWALVLRQRARPHLRASSCPATSSLPATHNHLPCHAVLSPVADVSLDTLATFDDQPSVLFSPHPQLGSLMDLEYYDRQELHTISIVAKKQKSLNDAGSYAGQASSSDTASPVTASRSPVVGTAPSAASLEDAILEASSPTTASQTPHRIAALAPLNSSAIPSPHILSSSSPTSPTAPAATRPALAPILVRRRSALLRPRSPASIPSPTSPALGVSF